MRERCRFRQSELTRAIKAALAAGGDIVRVEIEQDGRMILIIRKQIALDFPADVEGNPWDEVLDDASDKKRPT